MNKRMIAVALLALAVILPTRMLRAEEHGHGKKGEWKQKLGLTDDQVKKLDESRASEKTEMKPLREKKTALMAKLEEQIKNKAADADIKATLDEMAAAHKAMEASEEKFEDSRSAILTPTQQAKMMVHRIRHHEKEGKKEKCKAGKEKEDNDD
jgi:Spy/CpxP family protein refolding chaperone